MTKNELPELDADLHSLLRAEADLPSANSLLKARVFNRLAISLGAGPTTGGGLAVAAALLVTIGGGGLGYWVLSDSDNEETSETSKRSASDETKTAVPSTRPPVDGSDAPSWFGDSRRPMQGIHGRVVADGQPVDGASVLLTSKLTHSGFGNAPSVITNESGRFSFAAQRAAEYDVTASLAGHGVGTAKVDTRSPLAQKNVTIELSGCGSKLIGTVRDGSGGVIRGAKLWWTQGQWSDLRSLAVGADSDDDGHFEMCMPPGPSLVNVTADGYGAVAIREHVLGRRERDVVLLPEAIVRGRVISEAGEPQVNARVRLGPTRWVAPSRTSIEFAVTDSTGTFRFEGIAPGRHLLSVAETYRSSEISPVTIAAGEESDEIVLVVSERGRIAVTVLDDGEPVVGARIYAREQNRRPVSGWAVTDQAGRVELARDRPSVVEFRVKGYDVLAPTLHEALKRQTSALVNVASAASVRGTVVLDGEPVSGAEVVAISLETSRRVEATSGSEGQFELVGMQLGKHDVSALSHKRGAYTGDSNKVLELVRGQLLDGVELSLDGAGSISGQVINSEGAAMDGVHVQYTRTVGDDLCMVETDRQGEFVCPLLAGSGTYRATVRPTKGSAMVFRPVNPKGHGLVAMVGSKNVGSQLLSVVAARRQINGVVVDQSGAPTMDATVLASETAMSFNPSNAPTRGYARAVSDSVGRFTIDVWSGADYELRATTPTGGRGSAPVISGKARIVVTEPGTVTGTLVGFSKQPILNLQRVGNNNDSFAGRVSRDRFVFERVPPGDYAIVAVAGTEGGSATVKVESGSSVDTIVTALGTSKLKVRTIDFVTGKPQPGVYCQVAPYHRGAGKLGFGIPSPASDANGLIVIEVPVGPLEVICRENPVTHSEGAARVTALVGRQAEIELPIVVSPTPRRLANGIGARFLFENEQNRIAQLRPQGAAAKAGLKVGDILEVIDERDVTSLTDFGLERFLGIFAVGKQLRLGIRREGHLIDFVIRVEPPWRD